LFESPEYVATQRYLPSTVGVNGSDVYLALPSTVLVAVKIAPPEQVVSPGP